MKKKILFLHFNMELGGAESSLLGLLDTIDYEQYEVDLFLYAHEGALIPLINNNVKILPEVQAYRELTVSVKQNIADGFWGIGLSRIIAKICSKLSRGPLHYAHNYKEYFHKLCIPFLPNVPGKYDLAISFNDPHYIIGKRVNAKVKLSWFHTDASRMNFCDKIEREMWGMSDYIVNVSDNCKAAFDTKHPYLAEKSIVIENILSKSFVNKQSEAYLVNEEMLKDGSIKILSIGRFTEPKNFDNVPDICKRIRKSGINVKWYLIGYGGAETLIRQKINEAGMDDYVIILGKKDNPYPYIKACDLYVQPSRFEGKAVSVREAQMLCKPVVITRYATSASQLEEGVDGAIVPMDNEGCAAGIIEILRDWEQLRRLSVNCMQRDYSNAREIEKLYQLIEG